MKRLPVLVFLFALLQPLLASVAHAHALAPALLELREIAPSLYEVLWRTSISRTQGADVLPHLPTSCQTLAPEHVFAEESQSMVRRWQIQCGARGLAGETLGITGLDRSRINVILRVETLADGVHTILLDAARPTYTVPKSQLAPPVFKSYLVLGVEHLLWGLDHVLFVLALALLVRKPWPLVFTLTAFTLGHSVTLALATLGYVRMNPAFTELAIAASILILALEIARPRPDSLFRRRPWLMAGAFGLLHGLGFAGALAQVGLPQDEIPLALLAFNAGIELGQLMLVAGFFALTQLWSAAGSARAGRLPAIVMARASWVPSYFIGSLAALWSYERVMVLVL